MILIFRIYIFFIKVVWIWFFDMNLLNGDFILLYFRILLFKEFILKGYIYMVLMEEICVLNIEIVYVIKKWIVDDLLYLE